MRASMRSDSVPWAQTCPAHANKPNATMPRRTKLVGAAGVIHQTPRGFTNRRERSEQAGNISRLTDRPMESRRFRVGSAVLACGLAFAAPGDVGAGFSGRFEWIRCKKARVHCKN